MRVSVPDEFEMFCEREWPRLVGALSLYCGDRFVAEEVAQEALARACERWSRVSQMAAPGAWVHRVAVNAANSRFRRSRAERRALSRRHTDGVSVDPDGGEAVAIRRAVASLPDRQRRALVLRFFSDLSVAQTAAAMDVSESAVWSLTYRAMQTLRDRFDITDPDGLKEPTDAP